MLQHGYIDDDCCEGKTAQTVNIKKQLDLGRFTHRTSDFGNIGAKLNIGESVASVCRYVIVTRWRAFNKLHSHVSSAWLQVLNMQPRTR